MGWQGEEVPFQNEGSEMGGRVDVWQQHDESLADQSYKESLFSGSDQWSSLYEVDDYGVPLSQVPEDGSLGAALEEQIRKRAPHAGVLIKEESSTYGFGTEQFNPLVKAEKLENVSDELNITGKRKLSLKDEGQQLVRKTSSMGEMKQTKLFGFLGINPPKPEPALAGRKFKQQDIRALLGIGIPPTVGIRSFASQADSSFRSKRPRSAAQNAAPGEKNRVTREFAGPEVLRKCPFYKRMPGTSFTVDAFRYGEVEGCSAYFLTHFHYDHYGGLTRAWDHGPIYCTPVTARLCVLSLNVDPRWICPLQIGVSYVIEGVEVRMIDANHCPGAALILFRFRCGNTILHTGDFRACREMESYPELCSGKINTVYLDTTYCNHRYRFPLQEEVIKFVIRQTCNALKRNKKTLVVVGSYSIGKERVYYSIAEALGRRILKSLEWPELESKLATESRDTLLHVLPLSHLNPPKLKAYLKNQPQYSALLAFRPTGWTYTEKVGDNLDMIKPQCSGSVTIYGVPYSEHSSFNELRDFIQFIRPGRIVPTVNVGKALEREKMQEYFNQWLPNLNAVSTALAAGNEFKRLRAAEHDT
ncbi:hypothetical protein R1flu_011861 [Riccia fluitans]|uniref:DNA repair metallo-beta-lactamase domain-containing protein n=1 Tax=Riccia fluitans TaxID=41844 RepID=A0ABD1ZA53_9MARC